ncbi:hypothetical protein [Amorphus orientalis]|uniref:CobQ/CobB/MinD/ParA nucleotide binding domain-containing protein n=1 Tax=Amorphus orientalis TaxID=649198 RepID=A0AAE4AT86_9HYPH|nr:hypothetical protein [Amorphus orientalis]MDQ0317036.1 hypothetical protein [Amorphus orientalis]
MSNGGAGSEDAKLRSIICAARSGGQGKTTVAQMIHVIAQKNGAPRQLYSADFMGSGESSKLGKLYPNRVTELGIGATYGELKISDDLNQSIRYWDRVGDVLVRGSALIDLGANVIDRMLEWAELRHANTVLKNRNAPPVDVCVVCKSTMHSVEQAASLANTLLNGDLLPVGKIVIVINEADGKVLTEPARAKLLALREHPKIDFVRLPFCDSEVWRLTEIQSKSLAEALEWDPDDLVEKYDIDIWEATSGLAELRAWVEVFEKKLAASGLVPRRPGAKTAAK